ncbi:MAG: hypothetical protein JJW00_08085 [Sulfurimonas sp.]|nr:hypothetical protein [Sulfurimonas sp.]
MNDEVLYSIVGIIGLILIVVVTFRSSKSVKVNSSIQSKEDIINRYKKQLKDELALLKDDKELRMSKKNQLLKKFNSELALNIYFDKSEIRDLLLELSKES